MFWGLIMEPERRYTQKVENSFRITMAALDLSESGDDPAQVMCTYEGRNYLLCTLKKPDVLQCSLDLEFTAGNEVSFASNGNAHIHLTGYLIETDEDGLTMADLEEQEDEEDVEEEQEDEKPDIKKRLKKKANLEPPLKKAKLLNGSLEEEESDDPDFEETEAEESHDSSDEEEAEEEEGEEEEEDDSDNEVIEEEVVKKTGKKQKQSAEKVNGDQKKEKKVQQQQKKQKKTLEKGVVIEDLLEGNGPVAKLGRFINVYYEGRLQKNNKVFDSVSKGPGFKFRLGGGEVIKAWDIGLSGMKVGGKRKIICPPHTAYGNKGSPPAIPPNSTLVFIVELKKVN